MPPLDWWTAYDQVTTLHRRSGSSIGCRLLNELSKNCACLSTSRSSVKRQCTWKNFLTAVADVPSRSALCRAVKANFVVLRTRLGERAFSVAAPQGWNRLPTDLKTLRSTPAFKRSLKTFLFRTAYNVWFLGLYIPLLFSNCSVFIVFLTSSAYSLQV